MNVRMLAPFLVLALAASPTAAAHKTAFTPDGSIKIVWGFLNEPAVTMTKTGVDLILSDNATGAPLSGAETTLNASLVLGEEVHVFAGLRGAHGKPGSYTDVVTLTRPGLYALRLQGTLNGTAVDVTVPAAHEVTDIRETHFPELAADDAALAQRIADLEAKVEALEAKARAQSETDSPTTDQRSDAPGFALVAALGAVAAVALLRRRT